MSDNLETIIAEMREYESTRLAYGTAVAHKLRAFIDRLAALPATDAAGGGDAGLRKGLAEVYDLIPSLPVVPESCDEATTAFVALCNLLGAHDVALAAAPQPPAQGEGECCEARFTSDGKDSQLDEVVGYGEFHLEQMSAGAWWMQLGPHAVWLRAKKGRIAATLSENEYKPLARPAPAQGEGGAVAWQYRHRTVLTEGWHPWTACEKDLADEFAQSEMFETRALYARPAPAQPPAAAVGEDLLEEAKWAVGSLPALVGNLISEGQHSRAAAVSRARDIIRRLSAPPAAVDALRIAEAALADIGDADREPGDDIAWAERRAAQALPIVRAALLAAASAGGGDNG